MRTVLVLIAVALATPVASAGDPTDPPTGGDPATGPLSFGVGPSGPASQGEPYYVLLGLSSPEAPHKGEKHDDCSPDEHTGPQRLVGDQAGAIAAWDPREEPRISGWFPTCSKTNLVPAGAPVSGYASYDWTTGRYFVELTHPLPPGTTLPLAIVLQASTRMTGTTGVSMQTDCETCPPPIALAP